MRRNDRFAYLPLVLAGLLPTTAHADPGELSLIEINSRENNEFGYVEYLPAAYNEDELWPVLIFLSGIGEYGDGTLPPDEDGCEREPGAYQEDELYLCRNLRHGPQHEILEGRWDDVERPFIVISPQNNATPFSSADYNPLAVERFADYVMDTYPVDPQRIYLTGMSRGGYSVLLAIDQDPDRYAAIATMPGLDPFANGRECEMTQQNMWFFHGENDTFGGGAFAPDGMVRLFERLQNCPQPRPEPRLTIYDEGVHNVWTRTFDLSDIGATPDPFLHNSSEIRAGTSEVFTGPSLDLDPYDQPIYAWLLDHDKPIIDAGPDLLVETDVETVTFAATTQDADAIASVSWIQLDGAPLTLSGDDTDTLTLSDLVPGTFTFEARVVDADGQWTVDDIVVTIEQSVADGSSSSDDGGSSSDDGDSSSGTGAGLETSGSTGGDGSTGDDQGSTSGDHTSEGGSGLDPDGDDGNLGSEGGDGEASGGVGADGGDSGDSGCACSTSPSAPTGWMPTFGLLGAVVIRRRRRSRR